jgi:hypothetical protein
MQKYLVLYMLDYAKLIEWAKVDESKRKEEEAKLMEEWNKWTEIHKGKIVETGGAGGVIEFMKEKVADTHNDIVMYAIVNVESREELDLMFSTCPHLEIPDAKIQVMPVRNF